jgi:hypothetical protein
MYLALVEVQAQPIAEIIQMKFPVFGEARRWALRQAGSLEGFTGHAAVFQVNGPLAILAWELRNLRNRKATRADDRSQQAASHEAPSDGAASEPETCPSGGEEGCKSEHPDLSAHAVSRGSDVHYAPVENAGADVAPRAPRADVQRLAGTRFAQAWISVRGLFAHDRP